jgi:hypothetical protein
MTRNEITQAINGSYQQLMAVYNQYKIDKKHDAFFNQVIDPDKSDIHFTTLRNKVVNILRVLDQNGKFDASTPSTSSGDVGAGDAIKSPNIPHAKIDIKQINHSPAKKIRVVIDDNPHINREKLSDEMKALYDDNKRIYREMSGKHSMLDNAALSDSEAKTLLNEVLAGEEKLRENWTRIDVWYEDNVTNPKTPEKAKDSTMSEFSLKIKAAENYIRRYDGSKKPKQIAKLHEYKLFLTSHEVKIPEAKK